MGSFWRWKPGAAPHLPGLLQGQAACSPGFWELRCAGVSGVRRVSAPSASPGLEGVGQGALTQIPGTGSGFHCSPHNPVSLEGAMGQDRGTYSLLPIIRDVTSTSAQTNMLMACYVHQGNSVGILGRVMGLQSLGVEGAIQPWEWENTRSKGDLEQASYLLCSC